MIRFRNETIYVKIYRPGLFFVSNINQVNKHVSSCSLDGQDVGFQNIVVAKPLSFSLQMVHCYTICHIICTYTAGSTDLIFDCEGYNLIKVSLYSKVLAYLFTS